MKALVLLMAFIIVVRACRWAAYAGKAEIDARELFISPHHSLSVQSIEPPRIPELEHGLFYADRKLKLRNHDIHLDGCRTGSGLGHGGGGRAPPGELFLALFWPYSSFPDPICAFGFTILLP